MIKKVAHGKTKSQNAEQSCQIALFSSKTATESLQPYTVFCFDLQSCINLRLYKLSYKDPVISVWKHFLRCRDKAKRPKVKAKQKVVQNSLIKSIIFRMLAEKVFSFKFKEPWAWFWACYLAFGLYSRKLNTGWFIMFLCMQQFWINPCGQLQYNAHTEKPEASFQGISNISWTFLIIQNPSNHDRN